jgi:hypothetical protein
MILGYDLLCDFLEILNFNKYRSAVATRRNLVDPIQSRKQPDGLAAREFDLRMEGYRFELLTKIVWKNPEPGVSVKKSTHS